MRNILRAVRRSFSPNIYKRNSDYVLVTITVQQYPPEFNFLYNKDSLQLLDINS